MIQVITIVSRAFAVIVRDVEWEYTARKNGSKFLMSLIVKMKKVVESIYGLNFNSVTEEQTTIYQTLGLTNPDAVSANKVPTLWDKFPISTIWQTKHHKEVAKTVLCFCVASNVTYVSGWKRDETVMSQIRKASSRDGFIGIKLEQKLISGCLHESTEKILTSTWKKLGQLLPQLPALDFNSQIADIKDSHWYRATAVVRSTTYKDREVASFSEVAALESLLSFQWMCLMMVERETLDKDRKDCLLLDVMSIVLPMVRYLAVPAKKYKLLCIKSTENN